MWLGTNADNTADRQAKGRQAKGEAAAVPHRGFLNPSNRLTEDQVRAIRASKGPTKEVGAAFGIHPTYAAAIRRGARKAYVAGAI